MRRDEMKQIDGDVYLYLYLYLYLHVHPFFLCLYLYVQMDEVMDCIADIREYDVLYAQRVMIDSGINVGKWYDVCGQDGSFFCTMKVRADLEARPLMKTLAFDIETTKVGTHKLIQRQMDTYVCTDTTTDISHIDTQTQTQITITICVADGIYK